MAKEPVLNDLRADIVEKRNVAAEHLDIVKRLRRLTAGFDKDAD